MSTTQDAREIAEKAWKETKIKHYLCRRKCLVCFEEWKKNGGDKPPIFPSDYEGPCPTCGGKLSHPSVPF